MGGFYESELKVERLTSAHIPLARTQATWLHVTAREAGKRSPVGSQEAKESTDMGEHSEFMPAISLVPITVSKS